MPRHRVRKRPMSEINVVPYIDVMLVLLVIFMITAPLLAQGVKVDLPQVASEPLQGRVEEPLIVSVDEAGSAYLNYGDSKDKPLDAETLVNRVNALLRRHPGLQVLVKGDREAAYGDVVRVMALLQSAGTTSIGLITVPPEPAGG